MSGDTGRIPPKDTTVYINAGAAIRAAKRLEKRNWGEHVVAALSGDLDISKSKAKQQLQQLGLRSFKPVYGEGQAQQFKRVAGQQRTAGTGKVKKELSVEKQKKVALRLAKALSKIDAEKNPELRNLVDSAKTYYKLHVSEGFYKTHPLSSESKPSLVQKLRERFFKPSAPKPRAANKPIFASGPEKTTASTSTWKQEISSLTTKTPNAEEKLMNLYTGNLESKMTSLKERATPAEKRMIDSFVAQIQTKGTLIENKIHSLKQLAEMDKEISARNSTILLDSLKGILANRALSTPEQAKAILDDDGLRSAFEDVCKNETKSEVFEFIRDVHSLDANSTSATSQIKTIYDTYLKHALSDSVGSFSSLTIPTEKSKTININKTNANSAHLETINSQNASTEEKMSALNSVLEDYLTGEDNIWGDVTMKLRTHLGKSD